MKKSSSRELIWLPLEVYQGRYTADLFQVERSAFTQQFDRVAAITSNGGESKVIEKGEQVLDRDRRSLTALAQMRQLLYQVKEQAVGTPIYFSDFYTSGLDALAYAGHSNPLYSFCWAQSVDRHDFTVQDLSINYWMREWEQMAVKLYRLVFVASSELCDRLQVAFPEQSLKFVSLYGALPYDVDQIRERYSLYAAVKNGWEQRRHTVAFTSRWANEKRPEVFVYLLRRNPQWTGVVLSGSTGAAAHAGIIPGAEGLIASGRLQFKEGLTRKQYFSELAQCQFQFNASSQDWVSFTLLDALACGCVPVYPNIRSFPEVFSHSGRHLTYDWVKDDMVETLERATQIMHDHLRDAQASLLVKTRSFGQYLLWKCHKVMPKIAQRVQA